MNNIKQIRCSLGLTQEQFGKLIGVSRATVNYMENNPDYKCSPELIRTTADASGTDVYDICDIADALRIYPKNKNEAKTLCAKIKKEYGI